jgi:hypothetical protein
MHFGFPAVGEIFVPVAGPCLDTSGGRQQQGSYSHTPREPLKIAHLIGFARVVLR